VNYDEANAFQRLMRRFAASGPGSWLFSLSAQHLDRRVFKWTRGKNTFGSAITGLPIVMLTTTGAKSGKQRTVPVLGLPADDTIAVIASNWGHEKHPNWYYNLRANPDGEMAIVGGEQRRFRAVEATGERRARIWDIGLKIYPGWALYEKRASNRTIHIFVLERA
jgi:deazaflavin-dependent oxidoreductase (nitroreductase family)